LTISTLDGTTRRDAPRIQLPGKQAWNYGQCYNVSRFFSNSNAPSNRRGFAHPCLCPCVCTFCLRRGSCQGACRQAENPRWQKLATTLTTHKVMSNAESFREWSRKHWRFLIRNWHFYIIELIGLNEAECSCCNPSIYIGIYTWVYIFVHMYIYLHIYTYIYIYIYMWTLNIYVWTCFRATMVSKCVFIDGFDRQFTNNLCLKEFRLVVWKIIIDCKTILAVKWKSVLYASLADNELHCIFQHDDWLKLLYFDSITIRNSLWPL